MADYAQYEKSPKCINKHSKQVFFHCPPHTRMTRDECANVKIGTLVSSRTLETQTIAVTKKYVNGTDECAKVTVSQFKFADLQ